MSGAHTPTLTVHDGHYPGFRELRGLDFPVFVVMSATDIGWDQGQLREQQLQRLALAWNSHDQLLAERDALLATTAKLREALTELLDARGTSLNIVGHDPVSGHPLSREGMAALKARAALSSTTP